MCPGLPPEYNRSTSFVDTEGPAHTFARSLSDDFTRNWDDLQAQLNAFVARYSNINPSFDAEALAAAYSPESLRATGRLIIQQVYFAAIEWRKQIYKEIFKQRFIKLTMLLTSTLSGSDVLSRHLSYPATASAAGRSRLVTGYFHLTISAAELFYTLSLYTALCGLFLLALLKFKSVFFATALVIPSVDVEDPNSEELATAASIAQVVSVVDIPFMVLDGCLIEPLRLICGLSLLSATIAMIMSFIFPSFSQICFWICVSFIVYVVACFITAFVTLPSKDVQA